MKNINQENDLMTLLLCLAQVVAIALSTVNHSPQQESSSYPIVLGSERPIDQKIVAAYEELGAVYSFLNFSGYGQFEIITVKDPLPGRLPVFDFSGGRLAEGIFRKLPGINVRFGLDLQYSNVKDSHLRDLSKLGNLVFLNLHATKVTNDGLKEIGRLKSLEMLILSKANPKDHGQITDEGFKSLAGLRNLTWLSLANTGFPVSNRALRELSGLANITTLNLEATDVTDEGMRHLGSMKKLTTVSLYFLCRDGAISDAGMQELSGSTTLRSLNICGTHVSDQGVKSLQRCQSLSELYLRGTKITDASLKILARFPNLTDLDLAATKITDARLDELIRLNKLRRLGLSFTAVTDVGLDKVAKIQTLRSLELTDTSMITDAGLKRFRRAIPGCTVVRE